MIQQDSFAFSLQTACIAAPDQVIRRRRERSSPPVAGDFLLRTGIHKVLVRVFAAAHAPLQFYRFKKRYLFA